MDKAVQTAKALNELMAFSDEDQASLAEVLQDYFTDINDRDEVDSDTMSCSDDELEMEDTGMYELELQVQLS